MNWESAGRTDVGCVRKINEDSFLDDASAGLWVVADGMGGHSAGDLASGLIVDGLRALTPPATMSEYINLVNFQLQEVNAHLRAEALIRGGKTIGSTIVVLLAIGGRLTCLWAGDSRAYRLRDGHMDAISTDHSYVEELISQGLLDRENAEMHPQANVITRAVGADEELQLDIQQHTLEDGDRYLLCSDGLYKELTEVEISSLLRDGDCHLCCDNLVNLAIQRNARDNTTAIVVDFRLDHR